MRRLLSERTRDRARTIDVIADQIAQPQIGAQGVPVTIVSCSGDTAVLEVQLTDSPWLLVLDDG